MNYLIRKKTKSIKEINYIYFLLLFFTNCFFYIYDDFKNYIITYFILNIILILSFFIINNRFQKEFKERKKDIETLSYSSLNWNNADIKRLLLKEDKYKENKDTYKLFKNMYIKKNLVAKDYNDLKNVFTKFIPETFLNEVSQKGTNKIPLWFSVKKNLNVMFLDIIWFTTITEKIEPWRALQLLNVYFDGIVEIIKENWWYIDKFLGDGIMVIFDNINSDNVIKVAIEIQNFMQKFQILEIWKKIWIGIWINSWEVILWTIWSNNRMEITIIWDVVNTASRLEWLTRIYQNSIIISESTYKNILNPENFVISDLWYKVLKWKENKIKIYWVEAIVNIKI